MAKTARQMIDAEDAAGVTFESLTASLQRQIKSLRQPIKDLAAKFGLVREKLKDTAPKVLQLFNDIKAKHQRFTFVEFARLIDPSIPTHGPDREGVVGYKNHKTYYTLDYMRRLINLRPRGRQGVRDSATDALARTIATVLQVVKDGAPVWGAIQEEFKFNERQINNLRKRVISTQPLFVLNVPPRSTVKIGKVIHMPRIGADMKNANEVEEPELRRAAG